MASLEPLERAKMLAGMSEGESCLAMHHWNLWARK
jgi:hypothetical protein